MKACRVPLVTAVAFVALVFGGCSEDDSLAPTTIGVVQGRVTELQSGEPVSDGVVALFDVQSLAMGCGPARTTAAGAYRLVAQPGTYALVVYHDSLTVFDRTARLLEVKAGATITCDVRVIDSEMWGGDRYRIMGTVHDAVTGRPVCGAVVEDVIWYWTDVLLYENGIAPSRWATTDATGHFDVAASVASVDGEVIALGPLTVCKAGYEPFTLVGREAGWWGWPPCLPLPEGDDSTLVVEIGLRPVLPGGVGPHGAGAIRGWVTLLGTPVADVRVAVSVGCVADPDTLSDLEIFTTPIPNGFAVTDQNGAFVVSGLTPGNYAVHPAYPFGDGYVGDRYRTAADVVAGDTTDVGAVEVMLMIAPEYPEDMSVVDDTTPELRWTAIPDTLGYELLDYKVEIGVNSYITDEIIPSTPEPSWQVPSEMAFPRGAHIRWFVLARAFRASPPDTVMIADVEAAATFTVRP